MRSPIGSGIILWIAALASCVSTSSGNYVLRPLPAALIAARPTIYLLPFFYYDFRINATTEMRWRARLSPSAQQDWDQNIGLLESRFFASLQTACTTRRVVRGAPSGTNSLVLRASIVSINTGPAFSGESQSVDLQVQLVTRDGTLAAEWISHAPMLAAAGSGSFDWLPIAGQSLALLSAVQVGCDPHAADDLID